MRWWDNDLHKSKNTDPLCTSWVSGTCKMIYHIISSNHHKALLWQANIMGPAEQRGKLSEAWLGMQPTWRRALSPKVTFATLCCKEYRRLCQGKRKKKAKHVCQTPDISDRKARSLGPSGPMLGTSCLLPTLMAFPWAELPHVATDTHFSNPASSASNYIWLHWNQEGIWGQEIFICTKCLLRLLQEMVLREAHVHDVTPSAQHTHTCPQHNTRNYLLWALPWSTLYQVQQVWQLFKEQLSRWREEKEAITPSKHLSPCTIYRQWFLGAGDCSGVCRT